MTDDMTYDQAWEHPDAVRYAQDFKERVLPEMKSSAMVVPLLSSRGDVDVRQATEMGYALLLDKPMIVAIEPGTPVPGKLAQIADAIIEVDLADAARSSASIHAALDDLTARGVIKAPEPKRYGLTQPCCDGCFAEHNPGKQPYRLLEPEDEICVYCGKPTADGIYVRIDPAEAPHPTLTKDA